MTPLEKDDCDLIRALLKGKATNVSYGDLSRLLSRAGFTESGKGGSHRTWRHPSVGRVPLVDSGGGEILPIYVKRALRKILETGGCGDEIT